MKSAKKLLQLYCSNAYEGKAKFEQDQIFFTAIKDYDIVKETLIFLEYFEKYSKVDVNCFSILVSENEKGLKKNFEKYL